jgi:hypothetical protein
MFKIKSRKFDQNSSLMKNIQILAKVIILNNLSSFNSIILIILN